MLHSVYIKMPCIIILSSWRRRGWGIHPSSESLMICSHIGVGYITSRNLPEDKWTELDLLEYQY